MQRAGWSSGTPSPVLAVGGAFIDRTPPWLKNFAVNNFGTHDKQILLAGIAVVLLVLSMLIGVLLVRRVMAALVLFVVLVAVAGAAVISRPHASGVDLVPLLLGALVGLWTLSIWRRRLLTEPAGQSRHTDEPGNTEPVARAMVDRRRVLGAALGAVVVGALMTTAGRAISGSARAVQQARAAFVVPKVPRPVTVPAGASVGVPGVTPFIVPSDEFYRIDTALVVPQVNPDTWRLRVTGMVEHEVEVDWPTLQTKPMQDAMITLMCVSNEVGGSLNGNTIWTGWPVRELLAEAGVKPGADMVLSTSADGWTAGTPLSALTDNRNALVAVAMDGQALPPEHGFPARIVVPGLYGYVSATKWVTELKVTTYAKDQGYWTPRGWSQMGPVKTSSRIDVPQNGTQVKPGANGKVAVAGVAWAQHRGVKAVQVRIDNGPWQTARLGTDASIDAWRQWVYEWPATKGQHTIAVRATDDTGAVQTSVQAAPAPNGSSGYDTITVTVG
ncbi:oxidoreductase [Leekyejoonella antrihumi]|uniref:Oxidoreductase n=2 Tax=Leekyejoonella antrihumi TaxID=1660198 RepID=A0A563E5N3_9MICO|nr:oxidoreductase [Leekyejoonella antrihumi]